MQQTKLQIVTAWDDGRIIYLVHKEEGVSKLSQVKTFNWYFVIPYEDIKKIEKTRIESAHAAGEILKLVKIGEHIKIYAANRYACEEFVEYLKLKGVKVFEADLSLWKRYLVDSGAEIASDMLVLFFDIETDDSHGGIVVGRDRILSWAATDSNGNVYFESGDELEILKKFLKTLDKYDIFSGWYSDGFDLPYIRGRLEHYNIQYNWRRKIHIDLMQRCVKLYSYDMDKIGLTGFSLAEVSRVFIGESKIDFEGKISDLYNNDFEKFKAYNIKDTELLYKLNQKLEIIPLMIKECQVTGTVLNKFYMGELLDNYMLRQSKLLKRYLPTAPNDAERYANGFINIIGGYVHEPKTGLYDDVRIFDFKSLYPSIIVGWNIGQDVLDKEKSKEGDDAFNALKLKVGKAEDIQIDDWAAFLKSEKARLDPNDECFQTANNNFFRKDSKSFISGLVEELLGMRKEYKDKMKQSKAGSGDYGSYKAMQAVVKEMANSMYGITGDKSSRYFDRHIAEGITLTSHFLSKMTAKVLNEMNHLVIYGDTDSLFSVIPDKPENNMEKIVEEVNVELKKVLTSQFNIETYIIHLDYEKKYKTMLMIDKKKYTGIMDWLNEQHVDMKFSKGTEDIKRNTIKLTKRTLNDLILLITKEKKSAEFMKEWILTLKQKIMTEDIDPKDILITTRVSKPVSKYKSKGVHVKFAERLIQGGKIQDVIDSANTWGNRVSYIILNAEKGQIPISLEEFAGVWDRTYYWNTQIYSPMLRILAAAFPNEDWKQYLIEKPKRKRIKKNEAKK